MNNDNLKPQNKRTKREQREIAQKGGIQSGMKRRERRALKDELLILLSNGDIQEKLRLALINKALSGDVRAFETIRDTIGEKPVDKQELKNLTPIIVVEDERHKRMLENL